VEAGDPTLNTLGRDWLTLLQDVALARHYGAIVTGMTGPSLPNPLLERLLPSLLYIRLATFLDDLLAAIVEFGARPMPRQYRNDLNGRISYLDDQGKLRDARFLHAIRETRNEIAHDHSDVGWGILDRDIDGLVRAAESFGITLKVPNYEFFFERSGPIDSDDSDVLFSHDYSYGLKERERKVLEYSFRASLTK
jgi:hypothetical protein